jgi:hypothetical protein
MKTNLKNTKRITALLVAAIVIFCNLNAQKSSSNYNAKFVSFVKEQKSTLVYEQLNKLTRAIEEKIKFRAPSANDNENAVPVLLKYEYTNEHNSIELSNENIPAYEVSSSVYKSAGNFEELNDITSQIEADVKFKAPSIDDRDFYEANVNEITSQIEEQVKFKAPAVDENEELYVITSAIEEQIKFKAPSEDINEYSATNELADL